MSPMHIGLGENIVFKKQTKSQFFQFDFFSSLILIFESIILQSVEVQNVMGTLYMEYPMGFSL